METMRNRRTTGAWTNPVTEALPAGQPAHLHGHDMTAQEPKQKNAL